MLAPSAPTPPPAAAPPVRHKDLLDAIEANDTALVRDLIRRGADANGPQDGRPPLIAAAWACVYAHDDCAIIQLLLDAGAFEFELLMRVCVCAVSAC